MRAAAVLIVLAACGRSGPSPEPVRRDAGPPPSPDIPSLVGRARLHSFDEIVAAGVDARDQIAVVSIRRGAVRDADFTAFPCPTENRDNRYFLTFPPHGDDLVRAMAYHAVDDAPCARAVVRVRGVDSAGFTATALPDGGVRQVIDPDSIVEAETLAILDVTPQPAAPAPPGIDATRVVDIRLMRRHDGGVVAELPLYIWDVNSFVFAKTCDTGEIVSFTTEPTDGPLARLRECHAVKLRTRPESDMRLSDDEPLDADLIEIGPMVDPD